MENKNKGYFTKSIKYESEKEYLELADAIEGHYPDEVVRIISKIYLDGRLKW